jgi:transcriptional regulator with XRE-family HTH domain
MTEIGDYIRERRKEKNLTLRGLAELAGISHTEVFRIESGERKMPSVQVLLQLAKALGVSNTEMFRKAGVPENFESIGLAGDSFSELKTVEQQEAAHKIIDGIARSGDLPKEDYDKLIEQMEMFLKYVKDKRNTQ